jgi:hypothetical protein
MIRESGPWKAELRRDAELIERWAAKTVVSERRSALLERKLFVSAYALRRLNEAARISSRFREVTLPVTRFPPTGASVDQWNIFHFDEHYDMDHGSVEQMPMFGLLNLLIHSLIFEEFLNDAEQIVGFAVTSDNASEKGLYYVELKAFISIMREVGSDNPSHFVRRRIGDTWWVWLGDGEPPEAPLKRSDRKPG